MTAPRARQSYLGLVFGLLLAAAIVAVGVQFLLLGWNQEQDAILLRDRGVDAAATIVSTDARAERRNSRFTGRPEYSSNFYVAYSFTDQAGSEHQFEKQVPIGLYETLSEGGTTPVRYLPERPQVSEIDPGAIGRGAGGLMLGGIGIVAAGLVLGGLFAFLAFRPGAQSSQNASAQTS